MDNVFIIFQTNEDTRNIVEAILQDNHAAIVNEQPAMVRVDSPGRLTIRRASVEEKMGRDFDLQELHVNLISLAGNLNETDDEFSLSWNH
ncbi:MAG: monooxygenase [Glaciimonas sp.]|nr:monooxygenase [Glaciimonas sp.]